MVKRFLNPAPIFQAKGIACLRILIGAFMIYHGQEIFDEAKMKEYASWESFNGNASPAFMVYLGKGSELIAGILLLLGFLTRLAAIVLFCTMSYIALFVGHGKIWYEDQYPFLFALFGLVFIFTGPGAWSIDQVLFRKSAE